MPPTLTSISTFKQSITGAGGWDALAAVSGDSLTLADFPDSAQCWVEQIHSGNSAHTMEVSVYSTRFGDPLYGLRLQDQFNPTLSGDDGVPQLLLPDEVDIRAYQADTLGVQVFGTASDNVNVTLALYYSDFPGSAQRLATWDQIRGNINKVLGIEITASPGSAGTPGTAVALSANDNRWVTNRDYAILGLTTSVPIHTVRLYGPDTAFQKIVAPGHWNSSTSAGYFVRASRQRNAARIPVINSLNVGLTNIDLIHTSAAASTKVSLIAAELSTPFAGTSSV